MSAITIFNNTLGDFLKELIKILPQHYNTIRLYKTKFDVIKTVSVRKPMETYVYSIKKYELQLMQRDEDYFIYKSDIAFLKELKIKESWNENYLNIENKKIIWEYLQTLYFLGSIVIYNTPEVLSRIDEVVDICKKEFSKKNPETKDIIKIACETVRKKIVSNT
tara:strand:+ start:596 stop:1087 length:492 start_codon:yes stop_codon:yes gene_type:complete